MKRLGALLLPLDEMLVHNRVPSTKRLGALLIPVDEMLQGHHQEATGRITTPPRWDASSSQDTQHESITSIATPPWLGC